MENRPDESNPWKLATLALSGTILIVLIAGLVVANYDRSYSDLDASAPAYDAPPVPEGALPPRDRGSSAYDAPPAPRSAPPPQAAAAPAPRPPKAADVEDCNAYAAAQRSQAEEALKGAVVGGAVGAGVGAAGGAIAKGGKGAGKGAGIGSIVGAAVGTLYGLDQANTANAQAESAYRQCMARRGYRG
jgi:hypothetical protein